MSIFEHLLLEYEQPGNCNHALTCDKPLFVWHVCCTKKCVNYDYAVCNESVYFNCNQINIHHQMLKNYLISTLRNLRSKKSYAITNLIGLTLGFVCFIVITSWVQGELGYDKFHDKSNRIHRITGLVTTPSDQFRQAVTSPPLAPALKNDLHAVAEAVRIDKNDAVVESKLIQFKEADILLTDPSFFKVFNFSLIAGNSEEALDDPYSLVISQSMAQKYFGDTDPLGQTLKLYLYDPEDKGAEYTVTGIIEDAPSNSHIQYNFLISFSTMETNFPEVVAEGWFENFIYTYVLLRDKTDLSTVAQQLSEFTENHMGKEMQDSQMHYNYELQPIEDIYLYSDLRYDLGASGDIRYVIIFGTVGIFILLLGAINYINLATAFAIDRLKDAGIRKIHGATKLQLVGYYLVESVVLTGIAFFFSLLIIELFNPAISPIIGQDSIDIISSNIFYYLAGVALLTGLLSGILPSIYFSAVKPEKYEVPFGGKVVLRKGLVIFQFGITVVLLVGIFTINKQLEYIKTKDLGFDKQALITLSVNGSDEVQQNYQPFKHELVGYSGVSRVARSNTSIGNGLGNSMAISRDLHGHEIRGTVFRAGIDYDFIPTYGLELLTGRNFSEDYPTDSTKAFIVNEATVKAFGWESNNQAIGQPFQFIGRDGIIVGVVKNFNFSSLHNPVQPAALYLLNEGFSKITLKAANSSPAEILPIAESTWKKHFPGSVFEYDFVDDQLTHQYRAEQQFEELLFLFSSLSLVIACIGLYGLAGFSSKRRSKEIGIRKVLGASVSQITLMLNKEYARLILVAFLFGSVGAWFLMNNWLEQFAYRIELNAGLFLIAGGLAYIIALLAVSGHSIKAAHMDPVKTLQNE